MRILCHINIKKTRIFAGACFFHQVHVFYASIERMKSYSDEYMKDFFFL